MPRTKRFSTPRLSTPVATARNLWVPAINNHGGFGRWGFLEIVDPWDAKNTIRAFLRGEKVDGQGPLLMEGQS